MSQRNPCTDARRTETCVAPRHVDASRDFYLFNFLRTSSAVVVGGALPPDFLFCFLLSVQQIPSGIGHRVKFFVGLATNTLNVRNNNNNNITYIIKVLHCIVLYTNKLRIFLLYGSMVLLFPCFVMFGGSAWR